MYNYPIKRIRLDFPILNKNKIFLDNASSTYKPLSVINNEINIYKHKYALYNKSLYSKYITKYIENTRKLVSKFINSNYKEIIFTSGATESINMIAHSFCKKFLSVNDNIVISEVEHHSNFLPWKVIEEEIGIKIKILPIDKNNGNIKYNLIKKIIDKNTKFVSISHISNVLGIINDVKKIISIIKKINNKIIILIDGSQSISHIKIDVKNINCDFYIFSGHKMYGPLGIGILFGKYNILKKMNVYKVGGSIIKNIDIKKNKILYFDPPWKFEAGSINIVSIIGLNSAIKYINKIGIVNIYNWEYKLTKYTMFKLKEIKDLIIYCDNLRNKIPIISFNIKNINFNDINILLHNEKIFIRSGHLCSIPTMNLFKVNGMCRISFSMYTTLNEIKIFIKKLKYIMNEYFK